MEKLAKQIAEDVINALFTNGAKREAIRLILEMDDGKNGGGWGKRPAMEYITGIIEKRLNQTKKDNSG